MDGDIDGFINAYLTASATGELKKKYTQQEPPGWNLEAPFFARPLAPVLPSGGGLRPHKLPQPPQKAEGSLPSAFVIYRNTADYFHHGLCPAGQGLVQPSQPMDIPLHIPGPGLPVGENFVGHHHQEV